MLKYLFIILMLKYLFSFNYYLLFIYCINGKINIFIYYINGIIFSFIILMVK